MALLASLRSTTPETHPPRAPIAVDGAGPDATFRAPIPVDTVTRRMAVLALWLLNDTPVIPA